LELALDNKKKMKKKKIVDEIFLCGHWIIWKSFFNLQYTIFLFLHIHTHRVLFSVLFCWVLKLIILLLFLYY
jgi:hypothetical protein